MLSSLRIELHCACIMMNCLVKLPNGLKSNLLQISVLAHKLKNILNFYQFISY